MEIGTAETNIRKKKPKLKPTLSGGLGTGGGQKNRGGGGNGGDGNDLPKNDFSEQTESSSTNKFRIAMWFFLLAVLMTFGILIGAYVFSYNNKMPEWTPFAFDIIPQIWISTILIVASSLTYKISQRLLNSVKQQSAKNWLLATTVLGAAFISSQILAWMALVKRGVYVESNPYAGFFYIMTAVHAVHVLGGIMILGYIVLRTWYETSSEIELEERKNSAKIVGWYWHCMDALWLVLFLLLGFYK